MTEIALLDLASVTGGKAQPQQTAAQFKSQLKTSIEAKYKGLVCDVAGYTKGDDLAHQVYEGHETGADQIRAAQMLTGYCNGGTQLPAAAPKLPGM
jgi:hypothetical protein